MPSTSEALGLSLKNDHDDDDDETEQFLKSSFCVFVKSSSVLDQERLLFK